MRINLTNKPGFQALVLTMLIVTAHVYAQDSIHRQTLPWQSSIPSEFQLANHAPGHADKFVLKEYRFQRTGSVDDFFHELGRPDQFTRQGFYSPTYFIPVLPHRKPAWASFKYLFRNHMTIYMTGQKDRIFLAMLYKNGKEVRLLYK